MKAALGSAPGSVLDGKYALIREIGSGATGVVYAAEHLIVGKRVAIKVMNTHNAEEPNYRTRFVVEARAAARIAHANVVDIYDMGITPEGIPYLVMELLTGETLQDIVDTRGALPPSYACELILQVLAGLNAAHAQSIVHCDLKPANVMVTHPRPDRPLVKVLDFGIARSAAEGPLDAKSNFPLGTPLFMAPEQILGKPVDARADIYAVAGILWCMLAGQDPFEGGSTRLVLEQAAKGQRKPLLEANPRVPAALAKIIERALHLDPQRRPANVGELAELLLPFVNTDRMVSLSPTKQLSSDPIPLVVSAQEPSSRRLLAARNLLGSAESSVHPIGQRHPNLPDSLLISPRIPKAPTTPRLGANGEFWLLQGDAPWQPVIREKRSTFRFPFKPQSAPALLATVIGFGFGILIAWITGLI